MHLIYLLAIVYFYQLMLELPLKFTKILILAYKEYKKQVYEYYNSLSYGIVLENAFYSQNFPFFRSSS